MNTLAKIGEDVLGIWSLVKGLKITGTSFFKKQVTVHYPRAFLDNLSSFRGSLELIPNPEDPKAPLCIACMTCVSTCPTGAIRVVKKKVPKPAEGISGDRETVTKPKGPGKFTYDYTVCCQCALCVEHCPKGAIGLAGNPFSASVRKEDFKRNLLAGFKTDESRKDAEKGF